MTKQEKEKMVRQRLPILQIEINDMRKKFEAEEAYEICARLTKALKGISDYLLGYTTVYDLNEVLDDFNDLQQELIEQETQKIIRR